MKNRIISGLIFTLISGFTFAQDLTIPNLEGFKKSTNYPVYQPENLWDFINGAADTYLALGFVDLHVAEYKKGKETIKLEIYKHSDHTMAFGIYASERSSSYRFINLGSQGYIVDGAINFFKGNYYVKIQTYSKKPKTLKAEESLATRVAGMLQGETEIPALLMQFPDLGKKINEETYINESVLGHQFLSKAFKASYLSGTDEFSIFLMRLNSAEETFRTVEAYLTYAGVEFVQSDEGRVVFNDGYNGTIFLSWKEDRIVIISGLAKDQADLADRYTTDILK